MQINSITSGTPSEVVDAQITIKLSELPPEVRSSISQGAELKATVVSRDGHTSLKIGGEILDAELPKALPDGTSLNLKAVKVLPDDTVILRFSRNSSEASAPLEQGNPALQKLLTALGVGTEKLSFLSLADSSAELFSNGTSFVADPLLNKLVVSESALSETKTLFDALKSVYQNQESSAPSLGSSTALIEHSLKEAIELLDPQKLLPSLKSLTGALALVEKLPEPQSNSEQVLKSSLNRLKEAITQARQNEIPFSELERQAKETLQVLQRSSTQSAPLRPEYQKAVEQLTPAVKQLISEFGEQENPVPQSIKNTLIRLFSSLRDIKSDTKQQSNSQQQGLLDAAKSQLEKLALRRHAISPLLNNQQHSEPLGTLTRVIEAALQQTSNQSFREIASKFLETLKTTNPFDLRDKLLKLKIDLEDNFSLAKNKFTPDPKLPRAFQINLKSIYAQLNTAISLTNFSAGELANIKVKNSSLELLGTLNQVRSLLEEIDKSYLHKFDPQFILQIKDLTREFSPEVLGNKTLVELRDLLHNTQQVVNSFREGQDATSASLPAPLKLSLLRIESLLKEALESIIQSSPPRLPDFSEQLTAQLARERITLSDLPDKTKQALLKLLDSYEKTGEPQIKQELLKQAQQLLLPRDSEQKLSNGAREAVKDLITFLQSGSTNAPRAADESLTTGLNNHLLLRESPVIRELVKELSLFKNDAFSPLYSNIPNVQSVAQLIDGLLNNLENFDGDANSMRALLKSALSEIQGKLRNGLEPHSRTKPSLKGLKTIEQMIKGQEFLTQVNPMMQALGEPALIIFPAIIQGLISSLFVQSQTTYYPLDPDQDTPENAPQRKLNNLKISCRLPSLGDINVDIVYDFDSVAINLTVKDKVVAKFLSSIKGKLEKRLRKLKYSEVSCGITVAEPKTAEPDWTKDLRTRPGLIDIG